MKILESKRFWTILGTGIGAMLMELIQAFVKN